MAKKTGKSLAVTHSQSPSSNTVLSPREKTLLHLLEEKYGDPELIFEKVADGDSLKDIARGLGAHVFLLHVLISHMPGWREKLEIARKIAADRLIEEVLDIADRTQKGDEKVSQLQIEARKWVAGVYDPEKYGKQVQFQVNIGELHLNAVQGIEKMLRGG